MKKLFTLLAVTIVFTVNAQITHTGTTNTGSYSSAIGTYTVASAGAAFASGRDTKATGESE